MLAGPGEVSNRAGQDYVGRRGETESLLLLRSHPRGTLRDDSTRVLVKCPRLRQGFDRFLKLCVLFEIGLVTLREAENGDESLFLDFALDPGKMLGDIRVAIFDFLFVQVRQKYFQRVVVGGEILCNFGFRSQEVGGETAHAARIPKKCVTASYPSAEGIDFRLHTGHTCG